MDYDIIKRAVIQNGYKEGYETVINLPNISSEDINPILGRSFTATRLIYNSKLNAVICRLVCGGTTEFPRWYMLPKKTRQEIAKFLGV